jgi:EAL domain-containing protein (putative c-di-GMP-specific phosphodiesterase class I)
VQTVPTPSVDITIDDIVHQRLVSAVYQPIVDLDTGDIVAYEALARGPRGTSLEAPDRLFAAAEQQGLTAALDWVCRAAAVEGALAAELGPLVRLFINVEPSALRTPVPEMFAPLLARARTELDLVIEVTERALTADPAGLIDAMSRMRGHGFGIAIDDVGADPASLALLPFVEPDVIKLDLRLVQQRADFEIASITNAVRADAERRHALILAEGIETEEHLRRALVLGARLGQGWLFGRPGVLPGSAPATGVRGLDRVLPSGTVAPTPWALVAEWSERRVAPKRLLSTMSLHIEQRAAVGEPCVLLSAFQDSRHFTDATVKRYEQLALRSSLVAALGVGMGARPADRVRGGTLAERDVLAGEWAVTMVGPHEAAALIAKDCGIDGPESERLFEYVITHDRETVVAAARSLMQYIDAEHDPDDSSSRGEEHRAR